MTNRWAVLALLGAVLGGRCVWAQDTGTNPGDEFQSSRLYDEAYCGGLGLTLGPTPAGALLVLEVEPTGPAGRVGIAGGDYILTVDGSAISSPRALAELIQRKRPQSQVNLEVWRAGTKKSVPLTVDALSGVTQRRLGRKAWFGVVLKGGTGRASVTRVYPGGPAERAGIRADDVLLRINGIDVDSSDAAIALIARMQPYSLAEVILNRGGEELTKTVRTGDLSTAESSGLKGSTPREISPRPVAERTEGQGGATHAPQLQEVIKQNERIERLIVELIREIMALREELRDPKDGSPRAAQR